MRYSMGDCLAENAFAFYEKLHEPILLVNKIGKVIKINHAARRLAKIAHLSLSDLESQLSKHLSVFISNLNPGTANTVCCKTTPLKTKHHKLHMTTLALPDSDYFLLEVRR